VLETGAWVVVAVAEKTRIVTAAAAGVSGHNMAKDGGGRRLLAADSGL
jgi:hypothetical protein